MLIDANLEPFKFCMCLVEFRTILRATEIGCVTELQHLHLDESGDNIMRFGPLAIALISLAVSPLASARAVSLQDLFRPADFPHIASNQNRSPAEVIQHADGCTICRSTCYDPETQEHFPCQCTDYQECGGEWYDSGCIGGSECLGPTSCQGSTPYNGCRMQQDVNFGWNCTSC